MKNKKSYILLGLLIIFCICGLGLLDGNEPKEPKNVTFAVLPDTQLYSQSMPVIFDAQTQWIAEHAERDSIDFVLHLGDIVNNAFNGEQWENAVSAMGKLEEANVPYVVVTGNHDVDYKGAFIDMKEYYDDMRKEGENFLTYFPREKFQNMETYGGHSDNGYNQYHFVECGDYKILVLALDWLPSDSTLEWTEKILKKYSDMPTIIVKHDFLKPRGEDPEDSEIPLLSGEESEKQWNIFKQYNQIFMIINGHLSTRPDHGVLTNDEGNDVFVSVVDFQSEIRGGNGWMRLLELDFESGAINGNTFSPYVETIPEEKRKEKDVVDLKDQWNEFQQPFDLKARFENIGK